jgi:hypothetical protein
LIAGNGALLVSNDNWEDDSGSAAQLTALGLAPQSPLESGIYISLSPGAFTAILAGNNSGTGVGLSRSITFISPIKEGWFPNRPSNSKNSVTSMRFYIAPPNDLCEMNPLKN